MMCAPFASLSAHPHMWIDYQVQPTISGDFLEWIQVEWVFDEFFSSSLIVDMYMNKDRTFQADEVAYIRDNAFSHLIGSDYFADFRINGKEMQILEARRFNTRIQSGRVVYEFSIPVDIRLGEITNMPSRCFEGKNIFRNLLKFFVLTEPTGLKKIVVLIKSNFAIWAIMLWFRFHMFAQGK